jgi:hypothetical protein
MRYQAGPGALRPVRTRRTGGGETHREAGEGPARLCLRERVRPGQAGQPARLPRQPAPSVTRDAAVACWI